MGFTSRSEPARAAILVAARQQFTRSGYDRTTIRSVASEAGVDPAMVMRYYGSKEGLFGAAVEVNLHLPDVSGFPVEAIAGRLARHFVNRWEGDLADETIMILLRSAVTNDAAADRIRTIFGSQVVRLVQTVTGDGPDTKLRAGLISSQLLGVALSRHILRLPPLAALDSERLIDVLTPLLDQLLRHPLGSVAQRTSAK